MAPLFVTDPAVAAHYQIPVGTFLTVADDAEAAYLIERRHAFAVQGAVMAPAIGNAHPDAPPFVPFGAFRAPRARAADHATTDGDAEPPAKAKRHRYTE